MPQVRMGSGRQVRAGAVQLRPVYSYNSRTRLITKCFLPERSIIRAVIDDRRQHTETWHAMYQPEKRGHLAFKLRAGY